MRGLAVLRPPARNRAGSRRTSLGNAIGQADVSPIGATREGRCDQHSHLRAERRQELRSTAGAITLGGARWGVRATGAGPWDLNAPPHLAVSPDHGALVRGPRQPRHAGAMHIE